MAEDTYGISVSDKSVPRDGRGDGAGRHVSDFLISNRNPVLRDLPPANNMAGLSQP